MFNQVKTFVKKKAPVIAGVGTMIAGSTAKVAFCVGTADAGVVAAFSGVGEDIAATVTAVAPFGVGVLAVMLGFRYGKRILKTVMS